MKISLFIFIIFNICGIIIKRVIKMQKESKFKVEKNILIPLILFMIISVITIYCTKSLLPSDLQNLYLKQNTMVYNRLYNSLCNDAIW